MKFKIDIKILDKFEFILLITIIYKIMNYQ